MQTHLRYPAPAEYTVLTPLPPAPPAYGLSAPQATPRSRGGLWALVAAVLAVILALAVVGLAYLHRRPAPAPAPAPVAAPVLSAAQARLDEQVRTDGPAVEALADRWVPQLFAARVGTAPGDVASADAVLRSYEAARATNPKALLLSSGTFRSFERPGFYVIVMPTPFATSTEALRWCTAQGLARDRCFAKRLSHTAGPAGSTVYRS